MNANQAKHSIQAMCRVLQVCKSGYYDWVDRPSSQRALNNAVLVEKIRGIHAESDQTYGMPRVREELLDQGVVASRKRIARLMHLNGIRGVSRRRGFVVTTSATKVIHAPPIWSIAASSPMRRISCGWPT